MSANYQWEMRRGQAKWYVKGMFRNLQQLCENRRLLVSDWERLRLKAGLKEIRKIVNRWDKTTKEEREFYVLRHPKGS